MDFFACLKTEKNFIYKGIVCFGVFVCLFDCLFCIRFSGVLTVVLNLGVFFLE